MPAAGNHMLPESMRLIAEVLGPARAIEIANLVISKNAPPSRVSGTRRGRAGYLYVPKGIPPHRTPRIVEWIGREDALRLAAVFPGELLWLYPASRYGRDRRNDAIRRMRAGGERAKAVAAAFGLAPRTVSAVCSGARAARTRAGV